MTSVSAAGAMRGLQMSSMGRGEVRLEDSDPLLNDVADMDLSTLQRTVQEQQARDVPPPPRAQLKRIPEAMDDFVRNFLLRNGMHQTLAQFEMEWYERYGAGANHNVPFVADNYLETTALLNRVEALEHDLHQHAELTTKAMQQWAQAKKDRDFHRASHSRVVQEKSRLVKLLRQAHTQAEEVNPTVVELRQRCDQLFKAKTLVTLERDKLAQRVSNLERQVEEMQQHQQSLQEEQPAAGARGDAAKGKKPSSSSTSKKAGSSTKGSGAMGKRSKSIETGGTITSGAAADGFTWPADERPVAPDDAMSTSGSSAAAAVRAASDPTHWLNQTTFAVHSMPITKVALHPRKPAVASCSDDGTWRLSALPGGDVLVSGEGHRNWVSSIAMHPRGTMVATGSGDKTVKLWDFASNHCRSTLTAHTDGVWSVDIQDTGVLLASGSLDQTARVWDLEHGRCRQTLRGHVEAVNAVKWQPFTNILCTGSGDKTVSLWDSRMNCCAQTFYGHRSAVLSVATVASGDVIASCDAEGVVTLWDTRVMEARRRWNCGPRAANHVAVDPAAHHLAVASDDHTVKILSLVAADGEGEDGDEGGVMAELTGHEDAVQCVVFDPVMSSYLVSCGSDRTIRYWS